jgi:hypothetical protein
MLEQAKDAQRTGMTLAEFIEGQEMAYTSVINTVNRLRKKDAQSTKDQPSG